jgi:hypothetical protein
MYKVAIMPADHPISSQVTSLPVSHRVKMTESGQRQDGNLWMGILTTPPYLLEDNLQKPPTVSIELF